MRQSIDLLFVGFGAVALSTLLFQYDEERPNGAEPVFRLLPSRQSPPARPGRPSLPPAGGESGHGGGASTRPAVATPELSADDE